MAIPIGSLIKPAQDALSPLGGTLSDTWQSIIGDRVAAWRLTNAAALQRKINAEIAKHGVKLAPGKIPERYAFAWFEEATKQDEEPIQEMFAKLLCNAAMGSEDAADRRLLRIVSELTPPDAALFEAIYGNVQWKRLRRIPDPQHAWQFDQIHFLARHAVPHGRQKAIEHIMSLGLLEQEYQLDKSKIGRGVWVASRLSASDVVNMELHGTANTTALGYSLYAALYPKRVCDQT